MDEFEGEKQLKKLNDVVNIKTSSANDQSILAKARTVAASKAGDNVTAFVPRKQTAFENAKVPMSLAAGVMLGVFIMLLLPLLNNKGQIILSDGGSVLDKPVNAIKLSNDAYLGLENTIDLQAWKMASDMEKKRTIEKLVRSEKIDEAIILLQEFKYVYSGKIDNSNTKIKKDQGIDGWGKNEKKY